MMIAISGEKETNSLILRGDNCFRRADREGISNLKERGVMARVPEGQGSEAEDFVLAHRPASPRAVIHPVNT
eukprot:2359406-Rhodomonas_salina.1